MRKLVLMAVIVIAAGTLWQGAAVAQLPSDGCNSVAIGQGDVLYFLCKDNTSSWIIKRENDTNQNLGKTDPLGVLRIGPDGSLYGVAFPLGEKVVRLTQNLTQEIILTKESPQITSDPAIQARIRFSGLAIDSQGNVYVGDSGNGWLIRVSNTGAIERVAGVIPTYQGSGAGAVFGSGGDSRGLIDGPGLSAKLFNPGYLAVGPNDEIFIAEGSDGLIRKYANGEITTIAGEFDGAGGRKVGFRDGPANTARFGAFLKSLTVDKEGNIFVVDYLNRCIRQLTWNSEKNMYYVYTLAGSPKNPPVDKEGTGFSASFDEGWYDIAVASNRDLYVTKSLEFYVRKITWMGEVTGFRVQ